MQQVVMDTADLSSSLSMPFWCHDPYDAFLSRLSPDALTQARYTIAMIKDYVRSGHALYRNHISGGGYEVTEEIARELEAIGIKVGGHL